MSRTVDPSRATSHHNGGQQCGSSNLRQHGNQLRQEMQTLMVLNYIKEQISLGQIEAHKIYGKLNNADLHTKPLRSSAFRTMAHKILGQPPPIETPLPPTQSSAEKVSYTDMDTSCQPLSERKRARRIYRCQASTHLLRYLTPLAPRPTVVADEHKPATIVSRN